MGESIDQMPQSDKDHLTPDKKDREEMGIERQRGGQNITDPRSTPVIFQRPPEEILGEEPRQNQQSIHPTFLGIADMEGGDRQQERGKETRPTIKKLLTRQIDYPYPQHPPDGGGETENKFIMTEEKEIMVDNLIQGGVDRGGADGIYDIRDTPLSDMEFKYLIMEVTLVTQSIKPQTRAQDNNPDQ